MDELWNWRVINNSVLLKIQCGDVRKLIYKPSYFIEICHTEKATNRNLVSNSKSYLSTSDINCKISVKISLGNSKVNMESSETVPARDKFQSSEQCHVEDSIGNPCPKCYINSIRCSLQDIHLIADRKEERCTSSGDASKGEFEYIGNTTGDPHSTTEELAVNEEGKRLATNSERNLHSNLQNVGTKLEHYNKLTNNEFILPIVSSTIQCDQVLKTLTEGHKVCTALPLSPVNNSGHFECVCCAVPPRQQDHVTLSTKYEELYSGDLLRGASGSNLEVCSPLNVDCVQYEDRNKRQNKKKQRKKRRKRRSRTVDMHTE